MQPVPEMETANVGAATTTVAVRETPPPPRLPGFEEFHRQVMTRPQSEWMDLVDAAIIGYRKRTDAPQPQDLVALKVRLIDHCTAIWKWKHDA